MISFSDKRLYVKGTCSALCSDPVTGQVLYYSNKFQTGNVESSVTLGDIHAGLGNAIAAIIPSDSALNVNFVAADFSLWAKAAQVGAALSYNAVVPACQVVTANTTSLKIDVTDGAPTAQYGYGNAFCQVQEVGKPSPIATGGTQYSISPEGTVAGFTATSGTKYKVWYFVNRASAQVAELSTMFDPRVVHFTAQIAVYANDVSASESQGTRVGWLYVIVPRMKMNGAGTITGDQSNPDTTSLTGQAIAFDTDTVSAECTDCSAGTLAYYIYCPDNATEENVVGLAVVGGVVSVPQSTSAQIPVRYVMADGSLVTPAYSALTYKLTSPPSGTNVSDSGVITAGATTGTCTGTATFNSMQTSFSVSVV